MRTKCYSASTQFSEPTVAESLGRSAIIDLAPTGPALGFYRDLKGESWERPITRCRTSPNDYLLELAAIRLGRQTL